MAEKVWKIHCSDTKGMNIVHDWEHFLCLMKDHGGRRVQEVKGVLRVFAWRRRRSVFEGYGSPVREPWSDRGLSFFFLSFARQTWSKPGLWNRQFDVECFVSLCADGASLSIVVWSHLISSSHVLCLHLAVHFCSSRLLALLGSSVFVWIRQCSCSCSCSSILC